MLLLGRRNSLPISGHRWCFDLLPLAVAPTGSGKTVTLLNAIGKIGRTALVIVHNKELARQWRDEIKKHLGLTTEEIGTVEDGVCDYQGKSVTVAVIHNLVNRQWEPEFYRYFGIVGWDEGHRLGAAHFSKSMRLFSAKHRVTMTATPTRKDGCWDIVQGLLRGCGCGSWQHCPTL